MEVKLTTGEAFDKEKFSSASFMFSPNRVLFKGVVSEVNPLSRPRIENFLGDPSPTFLPCWPSVYVDPVFSQDYSALYDYNESNNLTLSNKLAFDGLPKFQGTPYIMNLNLKS